MAAIAQDHRRVDATAQVGKGLSLIEGNDCKACHSIEEKSVGPAYKQVALKYKSDAGAAERLAKKVMAWGSGVWGDVAMSAHPQLTQAVAREMVSYILSLAETKQAAPSLPVRGSYTMTIPKGDKGDGRYLIRAAYTDKGSPGVPPVTAEKALLLRNAKMPAGKADKTEGVMKYGTIIIASTKGSGIGFSNIDLTGITQIAFTASAPKAQVNAAGGSIEVRLDVPTGKLVGETAFIPTTEGAAITSVPPPVVAKLAGATGVHDVYLVFKNDKAPAGQILFVVIDLEFQTAQSASTNQTSSATQAATPASPSAPAMDAYAGKYKMTGMPFEYIEVTPKDGRLFIKAGSSEGALLL